MASSPLGNHVSYQMDWGDGDITEWSGPYQSGDWITYSHRWIVEDTYTVRVRAKDYYTDVVGPWSNSIDITIQKSRSTYTPLLNFLQRYPLIYQLIQRLL